MTDPTAPSPLTRRALLEGAAAAALVGGTHATTDGSTDDALRIEVPTFESLGVRRIVNGWGGQTTLGGNLMPPEVLAAMEGASRGYVVMEELMDAVGGRLAELTGAEWGFVTSGATAAMCAATCACVAGTDPERMARLPDTRGMKSEVLVPRSHRHKYDRGITMTGVTMVEVDTIEELEAAIGERTAMITVLGAILDQSPIALDEMVALGREHGVPVTLDAAAERPTGPDRYLEAGVDLVAYSAGKCIRGPQCAGFLYGREDLARAAFANVSPHIQFGRAMKVGKEEVMGALAALELWLTGRDHEAERTEFHRKLDVVRAAVESVEGVRTRVAYPRSRANVAPRLMVSFDAERLGKDAQTLHEELLAGDPRVYLRVSGPDLLVHSQMLEPGDEEVIAAALRRVLGRSDGAR